VRSRFWLAASAIVFLGPVLSPARAANWVSDAADSRLEFFVSYEGAEAAGEFLEFDVQLELAPRNTQESKLLVEVNVASATMHSADLDEAIAAPEWFDVQNFPMAEFRSDQIVPEGPDRYRADGTVTIRGVSKLVSVPIRWQQDDGLTAIGGELVLSRMDYGIGAGEWANDDLIAHAVRVRFDIRLTSPP